MFLNVIFFSWKNEFRQWIDDLEPYINVYVFNADDIRRQDRIQFLRHVNQYSYWQQFYYVVVCLFCIVVRRWRYFNHGL